MGSVELSDKSVCSGVVAVRIFVAVPFPPGHPVASALSGELAAHAWRPVTADRRHLTLRFLGEVGQAALPALVAGLQSGLRGRCGFPVEIEGVGAFPDVQRPDVLWLGCAAGAEALGDLAAAVRGALGLPVERGAFRGHVTVARRRAQVAPAMAAASVAEAWPRWRRTRWGRLLVETIHVFASELRPDGPRYTSLAAVDLRLP